MKALQMAQKLPSLTLRAAKKTRPPRNADEWFGTLLATTMVSLGVAFVAHELRMLAAANVATAIAVVALLVLIQLGFYLDGKLKEEQRKRETEREAKRQQFKAWADRVGYFD